MRRTKRVVIKEELVALTGDFKLAIVLNQMIYWSERVRDFDDFIKEEKERFAQVNIDTSSLKFRNGWIYKTAEDLAEECMITTSKATMGRYLDKLVEKQWIISRRNPDLKWDKTLQYRVNITKIQKDLFCMGYVLNGYRIDLSNLFINETPIFQDGTSKFQNETSEFQNDTPKFHDDTAIPEITTEITTEITSEIKNKPNLNPSNEKDTIYEILWNTNIPQYLKVRIKVLLINQSVNLSSKEILLIEDAYNYQKQKGFVVPDCSMDDIDSLNDFEFSKTVEKMLMTVKEIDNIRGLIKSWIELAFSYKRNENNVIDYSNNSKLPFYDWLNE